MNYFAHMKPFILFGSSIIIIVMLISAAAFINNKNEIPGKHLEVVLRDIGHQLLLSAKDSSSRVLPFWIPSIADAPVVGNVLRVTPYQQIDRP